MARIKMEVIELDENESIKEGIFGGEITIKEGKRVGKYVSGDRKFVDHLHIDTIKNFLDGRKTDNKNKGKGKNKTNVPATNVPAPEKLSKEEQAKADAIASAQNPNK